MPPENNPEPIIDATNPYRDDAERFAAAAKRELDPGQPSQHPAAAAAAATVAAAEATRMLAYETRTVALVSYLATLAPDDRHEGPAVLALVKTRLGLTCPPLTTGNPDTSTE